MSSIDRGYRLGAAFDPQTFRERLAATANKRTPAKELAHYRALDFVARHPRAYVVTALFLQIAPFIALLHVKGWF